MKQQLSQYRPGTRSLSAALAISALALCCSPGTSQAAYAGTTADATILNVVHVTYKDAGGTLDFEATAKTTVTVNLVSAPLVASAPPTDTSGNPAFTCPAPYSVASGSSVSYLYALTAAANGDETYKFSMPTPTGSNVVTPVDGDVDWYILDGTGAPGAANPITHLLGAATPVGVKDATTLYFPGGALAGFEAGDIVVVNQTGLGKMAYLVDGIPVPGSAATHTAGTKIGSAAATWSDGLETKGELKLKAFPLVTVNDVALVGQSIQYGGTVAPVFTANAPVTGEPVGEMVLVKVTATALVNVTGADGTVTYSLNTTDNAGNNPTALPGGVSCPAGNFEGVGLTITKQVRNASVVPADTFGANRTGKPGEILEYKVTVANTKGSATAVRITDVVPAYTTLIAGSAYGTAGTAAATDIFAKAVKDPAGAATTVNLTVQSTDTENANVASGNGTTGSILPGQTLTFYVGTGNDLDSGGVVDNSATSVYDIYYQVKID